MAVPKKRVFDHKSAVDNFSQFAALAGQAASLFSPGTQRDLKDSADRRKPNALRPASPANTPRQAAGTKAGASKATSPQPQENQSGVTFDKILQGLKLCKAVFKEVIKFVPVSKSVKDTVETGLEYGEKIVTGVKAILPVLRSIYNKLFGKKSKGQPSGYADEPDASQEDNDADVSEDNGVETERRAPRVQPVRPITHGFNSRTRQPLRLAASEEDAPENAVVPAVRRARSF